MAAISCGCHHCHLRLIVSSFFLFSLSHWQAPPWPLAAATTATSSWLLYFPLPLLGHYITWQPLLVAVVTTTLWLLFFHSLVGCQPLASTPPPPVDCYFSFLLLPLIGYLLTWPALTYLLLCHVVAVIFTALFHCHCCFLCHQLIVASPQLIVAFSVFPCCWFSEAQANTIYITAVALPSLVIDYWFYIYFLLPCCGCGHYCPTACCAVTTPLELLPLPQLIEDG